MIKTGREMGDISLPVNVINPYKIHIAMLYSNKKGCCYEPGFSGRR